MKVGVNPHLYPLMAEWIAEQKGVVHVVDLGSGTNNLARDFLHRDPSTYEALVMCGDMLAQARLKVARITGYETSRSYIEFGENETRRLDINDSRIKHIHLDVERQRLPHSDKSVDLFVSRHFGMHLSPTGFARHLKEIRRCANENRSRYFMTVLNPLYEAKKYHEEYPDRPPLTPGQQYDYPHGQPGNTHTLTQYYRPLDYYANDISRAGLTVNSVQPLFGIIEGYRHSHRRYYNRTLPMGLLFDIANVVPASRKEWYTVDVEGQMREEKAAYLREELQRFKDSNKREPCTGELLQMDQRAEFHALTVIYDGKYGPESNFSDEHVRKLNHPEIGGDFRDALCWLEMREGARVANMGVNDGYELSFFNQLYRGRDLLKTMKVYGVDVARQALEKAKEDYPHFQFIHGDGATLSGTNVNGGPNQIPEGWADLYMAITSFQSTSLKERRDEAFASALRVLRAAPDGKMLFAIPNCYYENDVKLIQGRFDASTQMTDHKIALAETQYLSQKLEEAGFEVHIKGNYYIFIAARRKR